MTGAELVYSPGYQLPLWLGPAQLRLWRRLDRLIGGDTHARTTVRALATALGANPGTISRDLDKLARLGLAVHDATWGRAGVRLWRVVTRGGRRGLDARRRVRAVSRMGVRPGQLMLALGDASAPPPDASPPDTADRLHDARPTPEGSPAPASSGPFGTARCTCGRLRLVMTGADSSPCPHQAPQPEAGPALPDPTPSVSIACLDYQAHRHDHVYRAGAWICTRCVTA